MNGSNPGRKKQVLICESQPVTAEGVRAALAVTEDFEVRRAVDSLAAAGDYVRREPPDLVLIDKSFGAQAVLQWLNDHRAHLGGTALVIWGNSITEPEALRLLQSGVKGIIRKNTDTATLITCMRTAITGANWMEDALFRDSPRAESYSRSELTAREQQVLELVEHGLKNREIAKELGIRPGTVKIHLKHIFEKTGVRGRYGLALTGLKERGALEVSGAIPLRAR